MKNNFEKINCFCETLYTFKAQDELVDNTLKKVKNLKWKKSGSNSTNLNITLHKDENFYHLHQWFLSCIKQLTDDVGFEFNNTAITQSWANKTEAGEKHHNHFHLNSFISGIFYLTDYELGTGGETVFIKECTSLWNKNIFKYEKEDYLNVLPQVGKLVLFPSQLYHGVNAYTSISPRYTISFNSFPIGQLGDIDAATYLNIELI